MNVSQSLKEFIPELEYELRMLLGSASLVNLLADRKGVGNTINYFKDSVYLHTRNLYNFFLSKSKDDARVTEFSDYQFDLTFAKKWLGRLNKHVSHIERSRPQSSNTLGDQHLNEQINNFKNDIIKLWQDWIDNAHSAADAQLIKGTLATSRKEALDDYNELTLLLKEII